jgi:FAD/FMN-containing dehydrogenase
VSRDLSRRAVLGGAVAGLVSACSSSSPKVSTPPSATRTPSPPPSPAAELDSLLDGQVLRAGTPTYASAVRLYDPRYDGKSLPDLIARVASTEDVAACVRWATQTGTPLHVRAGGHSYGGWSSGPGLVVDLRGLSSVTVTGSTARVGAGALLAPVYAALGRQRKAIAAGSCPTVGLSGLTLGGGVGVLTRAYGLTCDSVQRARVVTADGRTQTADPDLMWALKGGGGSFGIVTEWELELQPAPTVETFYLAWPLDRAEQVLDAWQHWAPGADHRLWSTCKLLVSSDRQRVLVAGTWIGPPKDLGGQVAPFVRAAGKPASRFVKARGYQDAMLFEAGCSGLTATSCVTSALRPPKRQPFAASSLVLTSSIDDVGKVAAAARRASAVPGLAEGGISFDALGGAVRDVAPSATAFPWRSALATVQITATWDRGEPAPFDDYVQSVRRDLLPLLGNHAYSNYADASIADYGTAYWGANYPRLQEVKRAVDPANLFSWPQSVQP